MPASSSEAEASASRSSSAGRTSFGPTYKDKTATRLAYGNALRSLGQVNESVVVIDGDVKNSTYADKFFDAFPGDGPSRGSSRSRTWSGSGWDWRPRDSSRSWPPSPPSSPGPTTRSGWPPTPSPTSSFCGSHVGVSIGEDGPSQMGLEDLAMFRPIPGCVVLYPSDAASAEACVEAVASHRGMGYIRTTRPATPTPLLLGRGVRDRRVQGPEEGKGRRGHGHRRRDHRPRGPQGRTKL